MALDDCTDLSWSYFLKKKHKTAKKTVPFIKELKSKHGFVVRCVHYDNAGENLALQRTV